MSNLLLILIFVLVLPAVVYSIRKPWKRRDDEPFGRLRLLLGGLLLCGVVVAIVNIVSAITS
ncbi:hypothetical protein [Frondihabitans sucicola]|uniref:hypothetical protein n=1 Tax=Frondihabitans sucicola TaxID=1268041 RepID=UPI002572EE63|nr:hypothetical protein [Frondihabitans sucicola]